MEGEGAADVIRLGAFIAKDGVPLVGKIVRVSTILKQAVYQFGPLVGATPVQEGLAFFRGRDASREVDGYPSDEGRIIAIGGRRKAQKFEPVHDVLIDEVIRRGGVLDCRPEGNNTLEDVDELLEPDHDGACPGVLSDGHASIVVNFGPILVVAFVLGDACDITGRFVVKMRGHHELLMRLRLHDTFPGID